jgi:hypothetical protein
MRSEVLTVVKMSKLVFCVVKPCEPYHQASRPDDGGSKHLRSSDTLLCTYKSAWRRNAEDQHQQSFIPCVLPVLILSPLFRGKVNTLVFHKVNCYGDFVSLIMLHDILKKQATTAS